MYFLKKSQFMTSLIFFSQFTDDNYIQEIINKKAFYYYHYFKHLAQFQNSAKKKKIVKKQERKGISLNTVLQNRKI